MKNLFLKKADNSVRVEVKVDIFATEAEILAPGFETRFTNMTIENYDDAAKKLFNIQEIENDFVAIKKLATDTPTIGLYLLKADGTEAEIVAP